MKYIDHLQFLSQRKETGMLNAKSYLLAKFTYLGKVGISTTASAVSAIAMVSKCVMRQDVPHRNAGILFICKDDAVLSVLKCFIQVHNESQSPIKQSSFLE